MMLWAGQAVSEIESAVTFVALPLAAVVLLHATTFAVALLTGLATFFSMSPTSATCRASLSASSCTTATASLARLRLFPR